MFCKFRFTTRRIMKHVENVSQSNRLSTESKGQWDLVSSVCLQRKPIITKDLNDVELKYNELINKVEYEMSYKSDHEIRKIKDKILAEKLKKEGGFFDNDKGSLQTAQEYEDACTNESKQFSFASRTTDDDVKYNTKSTNRKLSDTLLLVIKENIGNKSTWILPQTIRQDGETMRQAAERVLTDVCGPKLHTKVLGNAPCGFYKFRYPKSANKSSVGMKVFFFKALLLDGNFAKVSCDDFQWLTGKELEILPEDYLKSVKSFLIECD